MKGAPNPTTFLIMAIGALVVGSGAIYWQYSQLSDRLASVANLKKALRERRRPPRRCGSGRSGSRRSARDGRGTRGSCPATGA